MAYYETVFIARQDLSEKQVKDLTESFVKIITSQGGKIHKTEEWGLRNLAYKINKNRKGYYVLIECEAPGEAVIELERQMRLHEDVLRSLTVRRTALSEGPSPALEKEKDRDRDRGDRDRNRGDRDHDDTRKKREAA